MSALDISKFAKRTKSTLSEAARAIKVELFSSVIRDTRVRDGYMRGGWQTSTDSPNLTDPKRADLNGTAAIEEVQKGVTADGVDYLTNMVPYAPHWEEQDAMVERNLHRIKDIVRKVVK